MRTLIARLRKSDTGATAIEYAFIAAIVCIGIIASVSGIRDGLSSIFNNASTELAR